MAEVDHVITPSLPFILITFQETFMFEQSQGTLYRWGILHKWHTVWGLWIVTTQGTFWAHVA